MDKDDPFSQDKLNKIFEASPQDTSRLVSRENSILEFKSSFGWASIAKYMKTCAAYANAKGGHIVFGIPNDPHRFIGLVPTALQLFDTLDPQRMTQAFNEYFAPEISWEVRTYKLNEKTYGLLYIEESTDKPVVCTKTSGDDIREGDIYYRYRGRSEKIKYPELRAILEQKRENEQKIWMNHLSQIARIGVKDVGIFNLSTGQVTGSGSGSFLIDESLLSQLSFIKEGEFSEVKGKPTLRLIGDVEAIDSLPIGFGAKHVVKVKGIRLPDIVLGFLDQQAVSDPKEYIKQICCESTAFLPVYYYIHLSKLDTKQTIDMINGVISRNKAKEKLIARISNRSTQGISFYDNHSESSNKKGKFISKIKQNQIDQDLAGEDLSCCLHAIRALSRDEVKQSKDIIYPSLKFWFNKYYNNANPTLADSLRRAICWADEALFM
jgi:hypothetical protein